MKKLIMMGIVGMSSLLMISGVKAETIDLEEVSSTGQTVTVGEVDAPVYSVDITWGDMTFDYKYNEVTQNFEWREQVDNFELEISPGHITITDNSKYGQIVPSIFWGSEEKYNFVNAEFYYEGPVCKILSEEDFELQKELDDFPNGIFTDDTCSTKVTEENPTYVKDKYYSIPYVSLDNKLNGNQLPDNSRISGAVSQWYHIKLKLVNDSSKDANLPISGDKIGTITISIETK